MDAVDLLNFDIKSPKEERKSMKKVEVGPSPSRAPPPPASTFQSYAPEMNKNFDLFALASSPAAAAPASSAFDFNFQGAPAEAAKPEESPAI